MIVEQIVEVCRRGKNVNAFKSKVMVMNGERDWSVRFTLIGFI